MSEQRTVAEIAPDELHGQAFLGPGAISATNALVEGGLSNAQQLDLIEQALRAVVFHTGCHPLALRSPDNWLLEHGLLDDSPDYSYVQWGPGMPKGIIGIVEEAADRQTEYMNAAVRRAFAENRFAKTDNADTAKAILRTPHVAATSQGFIAVPEIWRLGQAQADAIGWVTRYSVAYVGGASLLAVEEPRQRFIDLFDEESDDAWRVYRATTGSSVPPISLPALLPVVLTRAWRRDDIPRVIRELKQEFSEQIRDFHELLRSESFVYPDTEAEAKAAAREVRAMIDKFFKLVRSTDAQPSYLRKLGPHFIRYGSVVLAYLYEEPSIAMAGSIATELLKAIEKQDWATWKWRPSLADRLHRLDVANWRSGADQIAALQKYLSENELKLISMSLSSK